MSAKKGRTARLANRGSASVAAQLDELRAQVDEACARARASIEVQHMAVDVEIAALLASLRRLQAQMDERSACTMPMTG